MKVRAIPSTMPEKAKYAIEQMLEEANWVDFYLLKAIKSRLQKRVENLEDENVIITRNQEKFLRLKPIYTNKKLASQGQFYTEKQFNNELKKYNNAIEKNNLEIAKYEDQIKYCNELQPELENKIKTSNNLESDADTDYLLMNELVSNFKLSDIPEKLSKLFPDNNEYLNQFNMKFYYYMIENAHKIYQAQLLLAIGDENQQQVFLNKKLTELLSVQQTFREHLVQKKGEKEGLKYDSFYKYALEDNKKYANVNPYFQDQQRYEQKQVEEANEKARESLKELKEAESREICNQFISNIKKLIESIDWTEKVSKIFGFGGTKINDVLYPTHVAQVYRHCLDWNNNKGDVFEHFNAIAIIGAKAKPKPWSFFGLVQRSDEAQKVYNAIEEMHRQMPKIEKKGPGIKV